MVLNQTYLYDEKVESKRMFIFNPCPRHIHNKQTVQKGILLNLAWPGLKVGQFRYQHFFCRLSYTLGSDSLLKLSFNISHGLM